GGTRSHEFQVIADTGEDLIVYNPASDYAANIELAAAPCLIAQREPAREALEKRATPAAPKCEIVAEQLGLSLTRTLKSIVLATDPIDASARILLLLIRSDHELNEVKVGKLAGFVDGFRFATETEILEAFGSPPGYLGPIGMRET